MVGETREVQGTLAGMTGTVAEALVESQEETRAVAGVTETTKGRAGIEAVGGVILGRVMSDAGERRGLALPLRPPPAPHQDLLRRPLPRPLTKGCEEILGQAR